MNMILLSILVLVLGALLSYSYPRAGLIGAVVSSLIAVYVCAFPLYGALIILIGILNLSSLEIIDSKIKGVDYSLIGMMMIATIYIFNLSNPSLLLASLVLVSVPTYILIMLRDGDLDPELGVKYTVFMVIATVLFIIGAVLLLTGIDEIHIFGYTLLILGFALEVGIAPLHLWVPDVFASADPVPASIIASIAKFVPFVIAFRIIYASAGELTHILLFITALIAAFSMFTGNLGALTSKEYGRVLGYSTVANMGYLLSCMVAITHPEWIGLALAGGLLLLCSNASGKIGFFSAMKEHAWSPLTYLLSFSFLGVPPLIGFWGKLFIAVALIKVGYLWLAAILIFNSAISIPYYLRLGKELGVEWRRSIPGLIVLGAVLITLLTILPPTWFLTGIESLPIGIGG
ncbi:MAG: proton-conducting transporter transmembrane domain-containing protein [Candidatus Syntropharchaeales archaeon]